MEYTGCPCLQTHELEQTEAGISVLSPAPGTLSPAPADLGPKNSQFATPSRKEPPFPSPEPILTAARASPAGAGSGPRLLATAGSRGAARAGGAAAGFLRWQRGARGSSVRTRARRCRAPHDPPCTHLPPYTHLPSSTHLPAPISLPAPMSQHPAPSLHPSPPPAPTHPPFSSPVFGSISGERWPGGEPGEKWSLL